MNEMFKLGDKAKFNKRILKTSNYVDFSDLTDEQEKELVETDYITFDAINEEVLPNELIGIIVGKRMIVETRTVEPQESEYGLDQGRGSLCDSKYVQVYLVATRMDFFYKVRAEWLTLVD